MGNHNPGKSAPNPSSASSKHATFDPNFSGTLRGKHIDLSNQQLTSLSVRTQRRIEEFLTLIDEVTVDVNNLSVLPPLVFEFKLRVLRIAINRFRFIPPQLHQMADTLVELDISHNLLEALPESLGRLYLLRNLKLAGNFITFWPESFCDTLQSLTHLDLAGNRLKSLPHNFGSLATLEELCVERNEICFLPDSIGELAALRILRIQNNHLRQLPPLPASLRRFNFWSNQLRVIPLHLQQAQLPVLDCYENNVSELQALPQTLSTLNCASNKFRAVPPLLIIPFQPANPQITVDSTVSTSSNQNSDTNTNSNINNNTNNNINNNNLLVEENNINTHTLHTTPLMNADDTDDQDTKDPSNTVASSASESTLTQDPSSLANDAKNPTPPQTDASQQSPSTFQNSLESLIFFRNHIESLPLEVFLSYPKLRFVDFAENHISALTFSGSSDASPPSGPVNNRIIDLNLSCNRLTSSKSPFFRTLFSYCLPVLNRLDLSMNSLRSLSSTIGSLKTLEHVNFSCNMITKIPSSFCQLENLKTIRAACNLLTHLPSNFAASFPLLHELTLHQNPLVSLPDFAAFPALNHLSVVVPPKKYPALPPSLKRLYLSHAASASSLTGTFLEPLVPAASAHQGYHPSVHPSLRSKKPNIQTLSHKLTNIPLIYGGLALQEVISENMDSHASWGRFYYGFSHMMGSMCKDEDRVIIDLPMSPNDVWSIFGILDGHGGSDVVQYLAQHLGGTIRAHLELDEFQESPVDAVKSAFTACNAAVHSHLLLNADHDDLESGCTAVIVLLSSRRLICANIGDSRAVLFSHQHANSSSSSSSSHSSSHSSSSSGPSSSGSSGSPVTSSFSLSSLQTMSSSVTPSSSPRSSPYVLSSKNPVIRLSHDHKPCLPEEVFRIQTQGGIVVGDLMSKGYRISHPRAGSHSGAIAITRSFGDFGLSPLISSDPHIFEMELPASDAWSLVLASDGVFDVFTDDALRHFHSLVTSSHPHMSAQAHATLIREASFALNSRDDISVIYLTPTRPRSVSVELAAISHHNSSSKRHGLKSPRKKASQD